MADLIAEGTWVEIHGVVLVPGERAPQLPEDTRRLPLQLRVKGRLAKAARLGEEAEVITAAGRRLRGTLAQCNPAYTHGFGPPIEALIPIGAEVRALLGDRRGDE